MSQNLFQDRYGILALAAHATLTKTSSASENHLRLRLMQWVNGVLIIIKQLFRHNPRGFSDFWIKPDVLMCRATWEECLQKKRKPHA